MAGDVNYPNSVLNLHFYGANNGTTFTDTSLSEKAATVYGNAKTSTAIADPFSASNGVGYFDGTGDYITYADSADWDLTGDFKIRFWVYFTGYSSSYAGSYGAAIISNYLAGTGDIGWQIRINGTSSSYATINVYTGLTDLNFTISGGLALNTWHEIEVSRTSGNIYAFANGTQAGTTTANSDAFTKAATSLLHIGKLNDATYLFYLKGYLADLQVYKGVGGHIAGYTPSTSPFLDYAGQLAGNITESLSIVDWRATAWRAVDGAYLETTAATTSYSLNIQTFDPYVITIAPKFDYKWSAGKVVELNDLVISAAPDTTPHIWKCTTAGTAGSTEPTWNLSGTTADNTVTWTYVAPLVDPMSLGPKIPQ